MSVVVVGSVNADIVLRVPHLPDEGETVLAAGSHRFPGGKGANQAVAAARVGAEVAFLGCVGADDAGRDLVCRLEAAEVDTRAVRVTGSPTGAAYIAVDEAGLNTIVVAPGANADLTPDDVTRHPDLLAPADVVVVQLEIPMPTVDAVTAAAGRVLLNAAPAQPVPAEVLARIDVLVVNEVEAATLVPDGSAEALLALGPASVVVTRGSRGALWRSPDGSGVVSATEVAVRDTTGAGDAFVGALAAALAAGRQLESAVALAVEVAGLATTVEGAQLPEGLLPPLLRGRD